MTAKLRRVMRIAANGTFTPVAVSCVLAQIVIAVKNAGTTWTLEIKDKASPANTIFGVWAVAVPADGAPKIIKFDYFIPMDGGIDIITAAGGPAGVMSVWTEYAT